MQRRALLSLIGAALGAKATGLRPKDVVGLMPDVMAAAPVVTPLPKISLEPSPCSALRFVFPELKALAEQMEKRRDARHRLNTYGLPPQIASMRSWSPAFKHHVAEQEELYEMQLIQTLWSDTEDPVAAKLLSLLGLTPDAQ